MVLRSEPSWKQFTAGKSGICEACGELHYGRICTDGKRDSVGGTKMNKISMIISGDHLILEALKEDIYQAKMSARMR